MNVARSSPSAVPYFAHHAVDRVRVQVPAFFAALTVVLERPEQGPVDVGPVAPGLQICAQARGVCGLIASASRRPPLRIPRKAS
jgi:hypothetical protein